MDLRNRHIPRVIVIALVAAATLAVLIPTCAMASSCGPMQSLLDCDSMWLPSDVAPGVIVQLLTIAFVAVLATLVVDPLEFRETVGFAFQEAPIPHPPDDPLMGRLII